MVEMDLMHALQRVRDVHRTAGERLSESHRGWNVNTDARLAYFWRVNGIAQSALLLGTFHQKDLPMRDWWERSFERFPEPTVLADAINESMRFIGVGLFHAVFSVLESSLRTMVRRVEPTACRGGTANFQRVYSWVTARAERTSADPLFNLLRMVRNTIHNNGSFYSPDGKDESVIHDGKSFVFRHGCAADFRDWGFGNAWEFTLPILVRLCDEVVLIVESPEFSVPAAMPE